MSTLNTLQKRDAECAALGETVRRRVIEHTSSRTPQEAQIARLARDGLSNPEIGGQLFISPRTVQYHLHKVFQTLDISSGNQLGLVPPVGWASHSSRVAGVSSLTPPHERHDLTSAALPRRGARIAR